MALAQPAVLDRPGMDFEDERIALACAFRWTARFDMHESVANHFSLAVDEAGTKFLMNPRGRHFSRVRASELLLLNAEDEEAMAPGCSGSHGLGAAWQHPPARAACAVRASCSREKRVGTCLPRRSQASARRHKRDAVLGAHEHR